MRCKRCGKNNPDNASCCLYCGVALEENSGRKQTESSNGSNTALVTVIIALTVVFLIIVGLLARQYMVPKRRFGGGGGGSMPPPSAITSQNPNQTEPPQKPEPEETEKPEGDKRAEKKTQFLQRAATIEQYTEDHLNTAQTQADLNTESDIVYKMWDSLLNDVYRYLKAILPESEFASLQQDELDWITEKEAAIAAAGAEWEGGSGEPLARNMVGIDYTMMRCYYLISLIK